MEEDLPVKVCLSPSQVGLFIYLTTSRRMRRNRPSLRSAVPRQTRKKEKKKERPLPRRRRRALVLRRMLRKSLMSPQRRNLPLVAGRLVLGSRSRAMLRLRARKNSLSRKVPSGIRPLLLTLPVGCLPVIVFCAVSLSRSNAWGVYMDTSLRLYFY